jgi:ADP-heptose:LPS heptosyltransferase
MAEITLIGLPWAASFVQRFAAYVDRFVPFPGYPGIDEVACEPTRTDAFLREQRQYGYDIVVQMHGSGRTSNPFALALGGALTVGYVDPAMASTQSALDIAAPYPTGLHEIERNLGLAALLGCPVDDTTLEFPLTSDDRREADRLLGVGGVPLIGVHPGAKHPSRRWPPERFAAVADRLALRHGARVVITGGPGEVDIARQVAAAMRFPAAMLAGETSLGGLAAVVERLDLYLTNDTGPAHIASAIGTPTVVVFGPADLHRWGQRGPRTCVIARDVDCRPCGAVICPIDHRCLNWIEVDEVTAAADALLQAGRVGHAIEATS